MNLRHFATQLLAQLHIIVVRIVCICVIARAQDELADDF